MTLREKNRRELQSRTDRARQHNIIRATETYAQTKKRIQEELAKERTTQ